VEKPAASFLVDANAGAAAAAVEGAAAAPASGGAPPATVSSVAASSVAASSVAVAQWYLAQPLLANGRKFDLRMYGLVSRASAGRYLCHSFTNGYARLSLQPYSLADLSDTFAHLTNASVQKQHASYQAEGAGSIWSLAMLEENLVAKGVCPVGWATSPSGGLQTQSKVIMAGVLGAAAGKFQRKEGYFDLLGFDLIVDEDLKVHLLEVNTNPALHQDNAVLEALLPQVVDGALRAVLHAHGRLPESGDGNKATVADGFEVLLDEEKGFAWSPEPS
jgi:hypothetical protein